jgi:hypothetical protein
MIRVRSNTEHMMQNLMTGNGLRRRMVASLAALATVLTAAVLAAPAAEALPYGPYTCQNGYVWREAFANDQVCVTPTDRSTVAQENAAGPSHTNYYTSYPYWCVSGYLWRQAKPTDYVCVLPASRDRERANNLLAESRLVDPSQTPQGNLQGSTWQGNVYASGSSLTPYGGYAFYWWSPTGHGYSTGGVRADARGNVNGQFVGASPCMSSLVTSPAVIVVDDLSSGIVTTAGTTWNTAC